MYFHVLLEVKEKGTLYETNKPELGEIIEDIVKPYLSNLSFYFDGYSIKSNEVDRILITQTEHNSDYYHNVELAEMQRKNAYVLISKEYYVTESDKYCKNITKEILKQVKQTIESVPKTVNHEASKSTEKKWDLFICHASEDKESIARPLTEALINEGYSVWFDEFTLKLGDSLRRSIDKGLSQSRFGVVILSLNFFSKEWPQKELDGLVAREINGVKVILPIWHNVIYEDILAYSPTLADKLGAPTAKGIDFVVKEIKKAI